MDIIDIGNFKDMALLGEELYGFLFVALLVGFGAGWCTDPEKRLRRGK